ncbi:hypothetical protein KI387_012930, partial [Taxus chinensis]
GARREMTFFGGISQALIRIIFWAESGSICEAIMRILGEEDMDISTRARVNSEVASWFVSQLLMVRQNVDEVRDITLHFIKP